MFWFDWGLAHQPVVGALLISGLLAFFALGTAWIERLR